MEELPIQVSSEIYEFKNYMSIGRWCSYYCQIEECLNVSPSTILIIGVGDNIVPDTLNRLNPQMSIETIDFDKRLNPDYCCDIREIGSTINKKYDFVLCCQVLEHLPFDQFSVCLSSIKQILSKEAVLVVSLPDSGIRFNFKLDITPIHVNVTKKFSRFYKKGFKFNGQHYWEVNSAFPYSNKKIRDIIEKEYMVNKDYLVPSYSYHRFYVCTNK